MCEKVWKFVKFVGGMSINNNYVGLFTCDSNEIIRLEHQVEGVIKNTIDITNDEYVLEWDKSVYQGIAPTEYFLSRYFGYNLDSNALAYEL